MSAPIFGYLLRRLVLTIPVLFGVMTIGFVATKLVPGDPLAGFLPENPTPAQYEAVSREFGLDRPIHVQWYRYILKILRGDWGRSLRTRNAVVSDLGPAISATLELALAAFALTVVFGVSTGVYVAARQGRPIDHLLTVISLGGVASPVFWVALMAQVLFYGKLKLLPLGGRIDEYVAFTTAVTHYTGLFTLDALLSGSREALSSALKHLILPATVLAYRASGIVVRVTRSAMIEVLDAQYVRTARSIGVPERRVVFHWAFRNALVPVITVLGLSFGQLLQGSILVEAVFNWPGLGQYTVQSIFRLDYPGVIAASMVITGVYVAANTIVDILYAVVDPRIRLQ